MTPQSDGEQHAVSTGCMHSKVGSGRRANRVRTCAVRIMTARGNMMAMPVAKARRAAGDMLHKCATRYMRRTDRAAARPHDYERRRHMGRRSMPSVDGSGDEERGGNLWGTRPSLWETRAPRWSMYDLEGVMSLSVERLWGMCER
jgi:hypothetical protein